MHGKKSLPDEAIGTRRRVYVGISGGVDSSVSAALLQQQGYDVTGVFIKVWYPEFLDCDWKEEKRDAMRICAHLDIPFKMLDLSEQYKKEVIDYMINEYKRGNTPNPDVMCNKYVKFGSFFDWAVRDGADFVATGHYAQTDNAQLLTAVDTDKDQTYFLWTLTARHIARALFPIGGYTKSEVRELAKKFGLFTETKKDSQGLCFLGQVDMKTFLKRYIQEGVSGQVLDVTGKVIGTHEGAMFYTIGERHGFTISHKSPHDAPLYIIAKDLHANTLTVSEHKPVAQTNKEIHLEQLNYIPAHHEREEKIEVRTRYRQPLTPAIVVIQGGSGILRFEHPTDDVASGQSAVFYKNGVCLGGGVVVE